MTLPPSRHLLLGWQVCCKSNCHLFVDTLSFLRWVLIPPNFNGDALRCLSWKSKQQEGGCCLNSPFGVSFVLLNCGAHRCVLPALLSGGCSHWSLVSAAQIPYLPPYHAPLPSAALRDHCPQLGDLFTNPHQGLASVRWARNPGVQFEEGVPLRYHPCTWTTLGVRSISSCIPWAPTLPHPCPGPFLTVSESDP